MKLEASERAVLIDVLVANCSCPNEKKTFESFSDETLVTLARNAMDGKETTDDDEEEMDKEKKAKEMEKPTGNSAEEWLKTAPPEIKKLVENSLKVEKEKKTKLIERLVANCPNNEAKTRLTANLQSKSLEELEDYALMLPTEDTEVFTGNFLGASVPQRVTSNVGGNDDDGDFLPLPTINYNEKAS